MSEIDVEGLYALGRKGKELEDSGWEAVESGRDQQIVAAYQLLDRGESLTKIAREFGMTFQDANELTTGAGQPRSGRNSA